MNTLAIIFVSLLMSAFFSGMEIAFITANRLRIELDKKQGLFPSRIVSIFTTNPSHYIATMLVGNNIALVVYGLFMTVLLRPGVEHFFYSQGSILLIQTLISTFIILITAEFLPKTLFRINPNLLLNVFAVPVMFFYILFYPITLLTIWMSNAFIKRVFRRDISKKPRQVVFGRVDLDHLVNESQSDIESEVDKMNEIKIFQNALSFSTLKVRDCMIPRTDIVAIDVNSTIDEVRHKFIETGISKILIYEGKMDNIIGYISHKTLFKEISDIKSKLVEITFVPETMSAKNLLKEFIQQRKSIAVVVDEFGGVAGMLTIEDIIEEIFGDIEDEHDTTELIEQKISENEYLLAGRQEIDYLNETFKLNLPESDEYDTLAGLIIFYAERLPAQNEIIQIDNFKFKIFKVTQTRIELVGLEILG